MKGDVRIKLSVTIVGQKEPVIAMDGESDQYAALLLVARNALDQAEGSLKSRNRLRIEMPEMPS